MTAEHILVHFHADDAQGAIDQAKAWLRAEPGYRLRTIASCVPAHTDQPRSNGWTVDLVVNRIPEPVA